MRAMTQNIKDGVLRRHLFLSFSFFCFCCLVSNINAQDWNSARLSILSPQQINFVVNSMDEVENGISVPNGTILGVTVANSVDGSALTGFQITVGSYLGQANFNGDATTTMPLDVLEITSTNFMGFAAGTTFLGPLTLDAIPQTLVFSTETLTNWSTHQIGVSYDLGTDPLNGLDQFESGYYTIEIDFILEPTF